MKIVLDTNVIISAIFFGGLPEQIIKCLFDGKFSVFASPQIVQEYLETYTAIHKKYADKGNSAVLQKIIEKSTIIEPKHKISICRDSDDDKFISCALEGKCLYIVSGDNDLLSLGKIENVEIITVSDFLKKI
ncbi:MAG: putative toxin-antitoxin system toxin component, PIN family [Spirochaetaceae bacterium]|nr:putative toxin-antitoxin system toxin component, PIN family [Spirochaetaceae bacterium]